MNGSLYGRLVADRHMLLVFTILMVAEGHNEACIVRQLLQIKRSIEVTSR